MSSLAQVYSAEKLTLSFEFFPPKSEAGEQLLVDHSHQLMRFEPAFVTCTYGAGGSTRDKTLTICQKLKAIHQLPVASHLTLVGATVDQLRAYLQDAREAGIDYIVALRGDPPKGQESFEATEGGFQYANQLVELLRAEFPEFGVIVAGYPETHQEAVSPEIDLANLKRKVEAGGEIVTTQLFYDNADFFRFEEDCRKIGIETPIVPGILPITSLTQIQRLSKMCGASLPKDLVAELEKHDDRDWQFQVGVGHAIRQVQELVDHGVCGLHFYVLNKSSATASVLHAVHPVGKQPTV